MYIFSFLGSWSIGGYTLSVAFALWALAIGHSLKLIKKLYHSVIAVIIGLVLWGTMTKTVDDVWWFLPFSLFSWLTSNRRLSPFEVLLMDVVRANNAVQRNEWACWNVYINKNRITGGGKLCYDVLRFFQFRLWF